MCFLQNFDTKTIKIVLKYSTLGECIFTEGAFSEGMHWIGKGKLGMEKWEQWQVIVQCNDTSQLSTYYKIHMNKIFRVQSFSNSERPKHQTGHFSDYKWLTLARFSSHPQYRTLVPASLHATFCLIAKEAHLSRKRRDNLMDLMT